MLALVFAYRNNRCVIQQNVCGLKNRIGEEANSRVIRTLFMGLVFELCHPTCFTKAGDGVQNPGEFRVGRNMRLDKQGGLLGVDPAGNVLRGGFPRRCSQSLRVLRDSNRMEVDNAEDSVVGVLHLNPLEQCASVITEMQRVC